MGPFNHKKTQRYEKKNKNNSNTIMTSMFESTNNNGNDEGEKPSGAAPTTEWEDISNPLRFWGLLDDDDDDLSPSTITTATATATPTTTAATSTPKNQSVPPSTLFSSSTSASGSRSITTKTKTSTGKRSRSTATGSSWTTNDALQTIQNSSSIPIHHGLNAAAAIPNRSEIEPAKMASIPIPTPNQQQQKKSLKKMADEETTGNIQNKKFGTISADDGEDIGNILAGALSKLSLQDLEKAYEDIHGVDEVVTETPELIAERLAELDTTIQMIRHKEAYLEAEQISTDYIRSKKFRLMFLRAELFDVQKAAKRLVRFMEGKKRLFGTDCLARPIYLSDLDENDLHSLSCGGIQMLPNRDRAGRAVFVEAMRSHAESFKYADNMVKAFVYMVLAAAEDEETQKHGMVSINYWIGHRMEIDPELLRKAPMPLSWIPLRFCGLHFCANNHLLRVAFSLLAKSLDVDRRARARLHTGTCILTFL